MPTIIYDIEGTSGPDILRGTSANDVIGGFDADDKFIGSGGSDALDGGKGFDTAVYRNFKTLIVLKPTALVNDFYSGITSIVDKGNSQEDRLGIFANSIEKVIGATGKANLIDASETLPDGYITVNLATQNVSVAGIKNIYSGQLFPTLKLKVENFRNVIGTERGDSITGDAGNNMLKGLGGNDTLSGGGGKDNLIGGAGNDVFVGGSGDDTLSGTDATARGAKESDILNPGQGRDRIILGDSSSAYYEGAGGGDLAIIKGISQEDRIVLSAKESYKFERKGDNFLLYTMQGSTKDLIARIEDTSSSIFKGLEGTTFHITAEQTLSVFIGI
ncbi:MAG: hypothetical protein KME32_02820 [Mojavia pulchra JT2-VF2]|jgi:Ca2+-binding RTX toxin-like protein|uniref:Calcium-binding protein n=1 Tax=Mojavia pulchra JT2-VF2 TaxID=287848 RepID=A0A951PTT1_9NOST|nr:hypothetical protein [Mojavia pulchra JT2-VF2]